MNKGNLLKCLEEYNTGNFSIAMLAKMHGVCTGKMYYILRNLGCSFSHKRRKPVSEEERRNRSRANKGKVISEAQRQKISERNSCHFNGMNGYGHTKAHSKGYVLAYAPDHPHAHADGYIMLHTVLMERAIGRYLTENEVVHHVNHDRADNRIENLRLMDKKEHMSMHMKERHEKKRGNDLSTVYSLSEI